MSTHDAFARDLAEVVNRHSVENVSDTPDVVLGAFLVGCLDAFDAAVNERARLAARPDEPPEDAASPDLWWPFTGGADTCYLNHDDGGGYRECCMRAGLAYALKVRDGDNEVSADFADGEDGRDGYVVRLLDMLDAGPDRFQESEEEDLRAVLSALFRRTAESANLATALAEQVARIAELERELRELRGTELNPSPLMLDAQAYGELRNEIAATMGDGWDLDEAEISILIKYVRWLAAGQPRDEDGYPVRRETYPAPDAKPDVCVCGDPDCMLYWRPVHEQMNAMRLKADKGYADFTKGLLEEICELRTELEKYEAAQDERDGDVRAVAALLELGNASFHGQWLTDYDDARSELESRFADRIAALEARDAKEV